MAHPDAALPQGFAGLRGEFEFMVFAPLCVLVVVWLLFLAAGRGSPRPIAREVPREASKTLTRAMG